MRAMHHHDPERSSRWTARRALVVDDEPSARRALLWLLADDGLDVTAAASGEEALALLADERYDLLLTDIRMPGIDGVDLMRRALILDPDLSVVVMTAHGNVSDAVHAMSEGAFWYVTKPVDVDALVEVIDRVFEMRSLREAAAAHFARPPESTEAHGPNEIAPTVPGASLAAVERHAILATVTAAKGDLVSASRTLGVSVPFLTARLRRYGVVS